MASYSDRKSVEDIVMRFVELVKKQINVRSAYLYGSYAKGSYTDDSDIDVAVVGDEFSGDKIEDTFMLMKIRRKVDNRIEPHPFRSEDFDISNPFVNEIVSTGIRII